MMPTTASAAALLLALVPGWFYLQLAGQRRPARTRGGLSELLEVLAVGTATTGLSVLLLVLLPHRWLPFLVDVQDWAREGTPYLQTHLVAGAASAVFVLALAHLVAFALHLVRSAKHSDQFREDGSVWISALSTRPKGSVPWVGLELQDGRLVEGTLHSFSYGKAGDDRDVALAKPIKVTEAGATQAAWADLDRFVVSARQISHMTVLHVHGQGKSSEGELSHGGTSRVWPVGVMFGRHSVEGLGHRTVRRHWRFRAQRYLGSPKVTDCSFTCGRNRKGGTLPLTN